MLDASKVDAECNPCLMYPFHTRCLIFCTCTITQMLVFW